MTVRYMLNIISALVVFNSILSKIVSAKHYRAHDPMPVIANTIGPYNNPTETYPVCVIINLFTHDYISYFFNYSCTLVLFFTILFNGWSTKCS